MAPTSFVDLIRRQPDVTKPIMPGFQKPGDQDPNEGGEPTRAGADASAPGPSPVPATSSVGAGQVAPMKTIEPPARPPEGQPESVPPPSRYQGESLRYGGGNPSAAQAAAALSRRRLPAPSRGGGGGQAPSMITAPDA